MARKTSANLVDAVERLLEDSTNVIFSAANASSQLQECLSELPPGEYVSLRWQRTLLNWAILFLGT